MTVDARPSQSDDSPTANAAETTQGAQRPDLLLRLPPEKRGQILGVSAVDHYVEVETSRGRAMVLMRFSDAVAELNGADGIAIHRSHWVARSAIVSLAVQEGRTVLGLRSGKTLPVARSRVADVRAWLAAGPAQQRAL